MSQNKLKCCIHLESVSENIKVKKFTDVTLGKCHTALQLRNNLNYKYKEKVLPGVIDNINGYHSTCYKSFTSVSTTKAFATKKVDLSSLKKDRPATSSSSDLDFESIEMPSSSNELRGSDPEIDVCIFCNEGEEKQELNVAKIETLVEFTPFMSHKQIEEVSHRSAEFKDVKWHASCRRLFKKGSETTNPSTVNWLRLRNAHEKAFSDILSHIEVNILPQKDCGILSICYTRYVMILNEMLISDDVTCGRFRPSHLRSKLEKHFKSSIQWHTVFGSVIFCEENFDISTFTEEVLLDKRLEEDAYRIRQQIFGIPRRKLVDNINLEDIFVGDADLPSLLKKLLTHVIIGPMTRYEQSEKKHRLIHSISSDIVYAVTNGRVKPAKHLQLGIALKNLCTSKKVVNIINHLGHCVSYTVAAELETELTYSASKDNILIPAEFVLSPDFATGIAFDNYDRFVETHNGKDTLHDTVGIIYQNETNDFEQFNLAISKSSAIELYVPITSKENSEEESVAYSLEDDSYDESVLRIINDNLAHVKPSNFDLVFETDDVHDHSSRISTSTQSLVEPLQRQLRRRRAYTEIPFDIEPYRKKPKLQETMKFSKILPPPNLPYARNCDNVWKISLALNIDVIPMWVGFNSKFVTDNLPVQRIGYLPQINMSPTSTSVVKETLNIALRVREECQQEYMHVTYDLAIAKVALQIQSVDRPLYDSIFISLGPFHILMSAFKAIGKYINECGLTDIITNAGMLSSGSIVGFLTGKHYNRCKRIHPIVAAAVEILHFKYYLVERNVTVDEDILDDLKLAATTTGSEMNISKKLEVFFADYESFAAETRSGEHGKTAQFFMEYVRMIDIYHLFSRGIRTNDIPLFTHCLPDFASIFFALNHPNYARWILRYYSNLTNADSTHPGLKNYFKKGVFTIRRTQKNFCRGAIDLNLEQTINADSANKLSGIVNVTNSISARQRWAKSRFIVASIISNLLNSVGLKKNDDTCAELKNYRIKRDNKHLNSLLTEFENSVNPFNVEDKNRLFNVSTGKSSSIATEDFLLKYRSIGDAARDAFINECVTDPNRFESPIKQIKTFTFANEGVKQKYTNSAGKVTEVTIERDHFAKLFCLALQKRLDISAILSYPLLPVPLALCHIDGTMNRTTKSALVEILAKVVTHTDPMEIDAVIFDGYFILRSIVFVPRTFGELSKMLLEKITSENAPHIHLVFDQYFTPSIKDPERERRGAFKGQNISYVICGPEQRTPTNYAKSFQNESFKIALKKFLLADWSRNDYASIIGSKCVFMNVENSCFKIYFDGDNVCCEEVADLYCSHEEADTRIIFHLNYIACNTLNSNIVIRATDTDVLIILLGNLHNIDDVNVWMEVGAVSRNSLRYLNCSKMFEELGTQFCTALIAFHVFTGCDHCASFFGIGKKKAYKIFMKSESLQEVFANFGRNPHVSEDDLLQIEIFVSSLYGQNTRKVNDARSNIFNKSYNNTKDLSKNLLKVNKSLDNRRMPPCQKVIIQKVKRLKYISSIWCNATLTTPTTLDPLNFGWQQIEDRLSPIWFEGDAAPDSINEIIHEVVENDTDDNKEIDEVDNTTDSDTESEVSYDDDDDSDWD